MEQPLTQVHTIYIPRVRTVTMRFGKPVRRHKVKPSQWVSYFPPDATFGLIRWHGNEYGTVLWQFTILRAAWPQQQVSTIVGIDPGAEILLRVSSVANLRWVLRLIRRIEARGIPATDVNPAYWQSVHNRLCARVVVPEYGLAEHAAYVGRGRAAS